MDNRAENTFGAGIVRQDTLSELKADIDPGSTVASRTRWARFQKGLYIVDVARKTSLTEDTIWRIEKGKSTGLVAIRKLSSLYSVPIWWLGCFENLPEGTFAQQVYKARMYYGMFLGEFAVLVGVDSRTIEKWEKGRTTPSPENMKKILPRLAILQLPEYPTN